MPRVILHVDLNSFFARAEQQTNPVLRGKSVGVIKAKGRTCIIAASPEAKKYGVTTGSRVNDARKLCPQIILVPANFAKYQDISLRFIKICADYSPLCEVFSLDECFIDVGETEKFFGNAFNIAFEIKERLKSEIGDFLTCSIGVSHNRLLAKLASIQIKEDGLFWITEDNALQVLDKSNLMDVCGLGFGLFNHLTQFGIDNFPKLRSCPLPFLDKHFGPFWSVHLYNLARGIDQTSVLAYTELAQAKSVGRTYTTHRLLTSWDEVQKLVRNLCEETAAKARSMNLSGRYVGLILRTSPKHWSGLDDKNSQSWYGHRTLKNYIDSGRELFEICKIIARSWQVGNIIFCGVTLAMLVKKDYLCPPLFFDDRQREKLVKATDKINDVFGDYTIFPARLLGIDIVRPEVTGYFGDKSYQLRNTV